MEMENIMFEENTEVMEPEFEVVDGETQESGGGNTALGMLIGAGLALATTAIVRFGKKVWAKHKAKKETEEEEVNEHDFVIPSEEDLNKVIKK